MSAIDRLSTSQGRKDQQPNKELAEEIVKTKDLSIVKELNVFLKSPDDANLAGDCLKVIEMVGEKAPDLIKDTYDSVCSYLDHPENKLQWRAMSALSTFAFYHLDKIYPALGKFLKIMDSGSVITRDHGFKILLMLYQDERYATNLTPIIKEQLLSAPDNQLGQYAEKWLKVIQKKDRAVLQEALNTRGKELTHPSHIKRVGKIMVRLQKRG